MALIGDIVYLILNNLEYQARCSLDQHISY